ncbi:hypothetical protein JCM12298_27060 [Desulfothermus naphthae]
MKNFDIILIWSLMVFIISGCAVRHGDFTVLSNKLIDTHNFNLNVQDRQKVTGEDINHIIIFVPTGGPPTLEGAIDDALDKSGGDVLTDAVIKSWFFYIPYIYGQSGWKVEGTAVKTRK